MSETATVPRTQVIERRLTETYQRSRDIRSQVIEVITFLNPDIFGANPELPERKVGPGWLPAVDDITISIEHELAVVSSMLHDLQRELGCSPAPSSPAIGRRDGVALAPSARAFPPSTKAIPRSMVTADTSAFDSMLERDLDKSLKETM